MKIWSKEEVLKFNNCIINWKFKNFQIATDIFPAENCNKLIHKSIKLVNILNLYLKYIKIKFCKSRTEIQVHGEKGVYNFDFQKRTCLCIWDSSGST